MRVEIRGAAPGVEWGKELSLLVEEWSSPESHKAWLMQMTHSLLHFGVPGWAPNLEATGKSNLHVKSSVVPFLIRTEPAGRDLNVWVNLFFMINVGHCTSGM